MVKQHCKASCWLLVFYLYHDQDHWRHFQRRGLWQIYSIYTQYSPCSRNLLFILVVCSIWFNRQCLQTQGRYFKTLIIIQVHWYEMTNINIIICFYRSPDQPFPDLEKEFEPNLLNSTVYMISMTLQLSTFAINYRVRLIIFFFVLLLTFPSLTI